MAIYQAYWWNQIWNHVILILFMSIFGYGYSVQMDYYLRLVESVEHLLFQLSHIFRKMKSISEQNRILHLHTSLLFYHSYNIILIHWALGIGRTHTHTTSSMDEKNLSFLCCSQLNAHSSQANANEIVYRLWIFHELKYRHIFNGTLYRRCFFSSYH